MTLTFQRGAARHEIRLLTHRPLVLEIDGRPVPLPDAGFPGTVIVEGDETWIRHQGQTWRLKRLDPHLAASAGASDDSLRAPMPGAVISHHAALGDSVAAGQTILTIESMKLQTALQAPRDGRIAEITAAEGATFEKDAVLVRLEPLARDPEAKGAEA